MSKAEFESNSQGCCGQHKHENENAEGCCSSNNTDQAEVAHDHHDGCGCGDQEFMYLETEDGTEVKCEVIGTFDVAQQEYIALLPEGSEAAYIYRFKETEEGPEVTQIEDDKEYEEVGEIFMSLVSFEDEDAE